MYICSRQLRALLRIEWSKTHSDLLRPLRALNANFSLLQMAVRMLESSHLIFSRQVTSVLGLASWWLGGDKLLSCSPPRLPYN